MPSFCKDERLCGKKSIGLLMAEGKKYFSYPFAVKWIELPDAQKPRVQLLVVVAKRHFKKAVDRNKIKRYIREAYRNNKELLSVPLNEKNKHIALMLSYSAEKTQGYREIEPKIQLILQYLAQNL
ncbi:MAG TPA: ribonuclease P protein component [Bacteroidales bacterium]|nr:ribonuclease P protein component [Bacteroidales bacterium]